MENKLNGHDIKKDIESVNNLSSSFDIVFLIKKNKKKKHKYKIKLVTVYILKPYILKIIKPYIYIYEKSV